MELTISERRRALVVDDEENMRRFLSGLLQAQGLAVETAADASHALDLIETRSPDVVLCDICMPGHDGAWLIDRLTQWRPEIPVIIVTGLPELDARLTLRPNVAGYLVKPFNSEELKRVLSEVLSIAERRRATSQSTLLRLPPAET